MSLSIIKLVVHVFIPVSTATIATWCAFQDTTQWDMSFGDCERNGHTFAYVPTNTHLHELFVRIHKSICIRTHTNTHTLTHTHLSHNIIMQVVGISSEVRWMLVVSFASVAVAALDALLRGVRCPAAVCFHVASALTFEWENPPGVALHIACAIALLIG